MPFSWINIWVTKTLNAVVRPQAHGKSSLAKISDHLILAIDLITAQTGNTATELTTTAPHEPANPHHSVNGYMVTSRTLTFDKCFRNSILGLPTATNKGVAKVSNAVKNAAIESICKIMIQSFHFSVSKP